MPKRNVLQTIAIEQLGGDAIMHILSDVDVGKEVERAGFAGSRWRRISSDEAAEIRARRQPTLQQAGVLSANGADTASFSIVVNAIEAQLKALTADMERLRAENEQLRSDIIGWGKTELAKAGQK